MSNNTNLSKLANVLDDGSSGQYLKSTGSGGVVFDDVAAGTTTVADITALEALSAAQGDMAFVLSNNNVYIRKTAGWYKIATVTNDQLQSVTVTMSGGGTAGDPYELALDGTDTTATGAATDPEGLSVTWSAAAISPATLSGNNIVVSSVNVATITQGTGASSNVFTIDPVATSGTHNFSLRFSVTDGVNATIDTDKAYTLNFVTTITDSKYTVLLAEGQGTGNNSSLTDSSSGSHTFTNTGTPTAGTFSPYRFGGYSTYWGGQMSIASTMTAIGTSNYTIEMWINFSSISGSPWILDGRYDASSNGYGNGALGVRINNSGQLWVNTSQSATVTGTTALSTDTWYHIMVVRSGTGTNEFKVYLDGSLEVQGTDANSKTATWFRVGGSYSGGNNPTGYIRDLRISTTARSTTTPTEPVQADSDTIWLGCSLPYIADASSSSNSVTITGDLETRPFGPYNSEEYDATDNGGSIYFPVDTGARLSAASSSLELGTGNFTIEGWLYHKLDGSTSSSHLFDYRAPSNSGSVHPFLYVENGVFKYGYGAYSQQITSGTVKENTWYHWAVCRSGTSTKLFLNGKQAGSTFTDNINYQGQQPYIGRHNNVTSLNAKGYLSDVRITKSDLYTADFNPPTAPLASTNSVLHMKGTDAKILDKNGSSSLTLVGSTFPVGDNTSVVYNGNTIYNGKCFSMTGTTGEYIKIPDMVRLEGTEDFTVEAWVNPDYISNSYRCIFANGEVRMVIYKDGNPQRQVFSNYVPNVGWNTVSDNTNTTYSIPLDEWSFLQFVRDNGVFKAYFNGSLVWQNSSQTNTSITTSNTLSIGGDNNGGERFIGKLQGLRVSKGIVRSTTVPTAPFKG